MKKLTYLAVTLSGYLVLARFASAQSFRQIFGNAMGSSTIYNANDVVALLESIGGFLIIAGGILAGIVIIVAGIMWMMAGSNPTRATAAKTIFKNGVIGALILFAAGVIINTILLLALSPLNFFN